MNIDLDPGAPPSPDRTLDLADALDQITRALCHQTRHHEALSSPDEADRYLGSLEIMTRHLPQLLGQLAAWFEAERAAGRLRIAYGPFEDDPDAAVAELRRLLGFAGVTAEGLYSTMNAAAQITAAIGAPWSAVEGDGDD